MVFTVSIVDGHKSTTGGIMVEEIVSAKEVCVGREDGLVPLAGATYLLFVLAIPIQLPRFAAGVDPLRWKGSRRCGPPGFTPKISATS